MDDPDELDATAGSYGLFGILLSMTFKLDRMTYATYGPGPITVPMEQYIPRSPHPLSDELLYTLEVTFTL